MKVWYWFSKSKLEPTKFEKLSGDLVLKFVEMRFNAKLTAVCKIAFTCNITFTKVVLFYMYKV